VSDKDSDFLFRKPLFELQSANSGTLYDRRALRDALLNDGKIDPRLEPVMFG
jgi:hypothetical protein